MKVLIFDERLTGHRLEYIHHLYMMAKDDISREYVFVMPESFVMVNNKMDWPECSNITIDLIPENTDTFTFSFKDQIRKSWAYSRHLQSLIRKHKPDAVFVNELITYVPFAAFLFPRKVRFSGIIYRIYLYTEHGASRFTKLLNRFKYSVMSRSKVFHRVFILNDSDSATKLCSIYHTDKFVPLADPVKPLPDSHGYDFRAENGISSDKTLFIHFGGLTKRKGTLLLLDSLNALSEQERKQYVFAFAGKIYDDIRDEFYQRLSSIEGRVNVIVKDEFCSYEYLAAMCQACDAIVCPYLDTSLSSGMLGYASQFGKPVIAPGTGLLGNLIRTYKLGFATQDCSSSEMLKGYQAIAGNSISKPEQDYCQINSLQTFVNTLKSQI